MMNKKASIGATLTWIIGVIVLALGLALLIIIAAGLFAKKQGIAVTTEGIGNEVLLNKKIIEFLNKPVSETQTVKDLIVLAGTEDGEKERRELFKAEAKKFIDEVVPVGSGEYARTWVRIYKPGDKIEQYYPNAPYGDYSAESSFVGGSGGIVCDPSSTNGLLVTFLADSDKIIALCADHALGVK